MFATILYLPVFGGVNWRASSLMISTLARAGLFFSPGIKSWSISIAVVCAAFFASSSVRMPSPGPISKIRSLFVTSAVSTICSTIV